MLTFHSHEPQPVSDAYKFNDRLLSLRPGVADSRGDRAQATPEISLDELHRRDMWDDGEDAGILPFIAILGGSVIVSLLLLGYLLWEVSQ